MSCRRCSQNDDSLGSYQCDECTDGLYLLSTTTQNMLNSTDSAYESLSFCVNECRDFAYNFANNPNTMRCEYCGEKCTLCSTSLGCVESYIVGHGFRNLEAESYPISTSLYSDSTPSASFSTPYACTDARCDECQSTDSTYGISTLEYPICDSCYQYVNLYPVAKQEILNCSLCTNDDLDNCNTCDPDRPTLCASCNSGYYLITTVSNGQDLIVSTECSVCDSDVMVTGCNRCDETICLECESGYALTDDGLCLECDLTDFNANYFYYPDRCSQCTSTDATECAYCDVGFLDSLSEPEKCALKCDDG